MKVFLAFNCGDWRNKMNTQAQTILSTFDSLSERVRFEVALASEILKTGRL